MIEVFFRTNLDVQREVWPTLVPALPRVGDYVTSKQGLELQVCRVTFEYDRRPTIELHLDPRRWKNLDEFTKWYRDR